MSLLLIAKNRNMGPWEQALLKEESDLDIEIWPDIQEPEKVQFAAAWGQPAHSLKQLPNLKAVSSLGAGVDHILNDKTLPEGLKICRIIDPHLTDDMKKYTQAAVLNYRLSSYKYYEQKLEAKWKRLPRKRIDDVIIGVMGLGKIGQPVAKNLAQLGYQVKSWANSKHDSKGVTVFSGNGELNSFLDGTELIICLLPLTPETRGVLNLELFKKLKHPGFVINVGRGEHLVEEDLIYALDKQWLSGAQLDVFSEEPLPGNHPFWNRKNIVISPHVSAETSPSSVAAQIIENYKRTISGLPLINEVDKQKRY